MAHFNSPAPQYTCAMTTYRNMCRLAKANPTSARRILRLVRAGELSNFVILYDKKRDPNNDRADRPPSRAMSYLNRIAGVNLSQFVVWIPPREGYEHFVERIVFDYDVTHFFGTSKKVIDLIEKIRSIRIEVLKLPNDDFNLVDKWLIKSSPQFYKTEAMAQDAFNIIKTGTAVES